MKVDIKQKNPTVEELLRDQTQCITIDANFFIAPDRCNEGLPDAFGQERYKKVWIEPFFATFSNLAIHEAVHMELLEGTEIRAYVDEKIRAGDLQVLSDATLTLEELALRNTFESNIAPNTQFDPSRDNRDDRGEVKTLAHLGAKGYIFFATNDGNALRLVDEAEKLHTLLDSQATVKFYEGIYVLKRLGAVPPNQIKWLYKYIYKMSKRDRNLEWGDFIERMDRLYCS